MANQIVLYVGSIAVIVWGIAHIVPTVSVVAGFGQLSKDNTRIITMEWIAEGLTLCFIGILVLFVTLSSGPGNSVALLVYRMSAGMLFSMAVLTAFTGARTSIVPIKICPVVKTTVGILFLVGSIL